MKILQLRHMPFYLAAILGVAGFSLSYPFDKPLAPVIGANCFFLTFLIAALTRLPYLTPERLRRKKDYTDAPAPVIFGLTLAIVIVAVVSMFILVNRKPEPDILSLLTTLLSVPLGWATMHMMAALHYAHVYWQRKDGNDEDPYKRGMEIPNTPDPTGWDFVYCAYMIGMSAGTGDTAVTTRQMRALTLPHCIISFFFNTVLVATAVNVAMELG